MADTSSILKSDEAAAAAPEQAEEAVNFDELETHERVGELERALRGVGPNPPTDGEEPTEGLPEPTEEAAAPTTDEFETKLAALQAKAEEERARVAAKKRTDVKAVDLRKKEEELASIAYRVLETQKEANAALGKVAAFEKMSVQELIYEAMQRSGDANAVAEAFLAMNDPATIASIQAKKRESETVHPMQKRLDELEARLAEKEQEAERAQSQAHLYKEVTEAASLSQQHAAEVPYVAKLAANNQRIFMLRFNEARSMLMQEHGQAPTGHVLLRMEEDLAPELNEIRQAFGWGESPSGVSSSSSAPSGGVKPKMVTNRATSQRTQIAEEGDDLPSDVRERARLLEQRLRG